MNKLSETPDPVKEPGSQGFWNSKTAPFPFNNRGEVDGGDPPDPNLVDPNQPAPGDDNPFLAQFPDDIKKDSTMQPIKDMNGLAKSYINGQRLLGKNRIALPGENATDQERADFYKATGRPDSAEGYEFNKELVHPSMGEQRDELVKAVQGMMFDAGLSKAQAETIFTKYNEHIGGIFEATVAKQEQQVTEWIDQLKVDFGQAFQQKIVLAKTAMQEFGGEDMTALMEETGLGNHPAVVKFMSAVGAKLSGDKIVDGDGKPLGFQMSSEEAKAEIKKLEADKDWLKRFQTKSEPGHQDAKEQRARLFKIAYPD